MKKVEKVSVGRMPFTLEEDAFATLNAYLGELNAYYGRTEGGREVMEGIEERIAELLTERCGTYGVASDGEIKETIAILGRPETLEDADFGVEFGQAKETQVRKKLYRNTQDKVLGGVCSGIAAYFDADTSLVRILFLVLSLGLFSITLLNWNFSGIAFFLYLIGWIVIPPARTVQQQCEMRGQSGSIEDIRRNVELRATKEPATTSRVWKALRIFLGICLFIVAVSGIAIGTTYSIWNWNDMFSYPMSWGSLNPEFMPDAFPFVVFALWFLPFLGMLYGSIMLMFNLRSPRWRPGLIILLLWIVSIILTLGMTAHYYINISI